MKFEKIVKYLNCEYPQHLRATWDNTDGLVQGDPAIEVKKGIVALEISKNTPETEFLILHHPPIFGTEKKVTNPFYEKFKDTPIYAIHSRIDKTGELNTAFAKFVFQDCKVEKVLEDGTTIIVLNSALQFTEVIELIKTKLQKQTLKTISQTRRIKRIAIHGGEGFNQHHVQLAAEQNPDLYLGGDLTHHLAEAARFTKMSLIDIEHTSEEIGMRYLSEKLSRQFPEVQFEYMDSPTHWSFK